MMQNCIYRRDNLKVLQTLEDNSIHLIYAKPPSARLIDIDEYLKDLKPRFEEAYRCLANNGTLYFHSNYEIIHYCKILLLDEIFGSRECYLNEIIWTYDSSEKVAGRWTPKHDTILVYVKNPSDYTFNSEDIDRISYLAPGLVGEEKESKGKLPTDTWWYTNIENNGEEEVTTSNLPTQMLKRIISASSNPGEVVIDFYAREGKVGEVCLELNRNFILVEKSTNAVKQMASKFHNIESIEWINFNPNDI